MDSACINNGKDNASSRGGIWYGSDNPRNRALKIPGETQSNQTGELAAVILATQNMPHFCPLEIISDSKYIINSLTEHLPRWEDIGWIQIKNNDMFKKAAFLLKRRSTVTTFKWTKGHQGNLGNEESNRLAKEGAEKDTPDDLDLTISAEYDLQGAKLTAITQATAYQGILEKRTHPPRCDTQENIRQIKTAIEQITSSKEMKEMIWKNNRKPVL
jgi:ribonuclease HI